MYITDGAGNRMKIVEDAFPLWKSRGWSPDTDQDGVADILTGGSGGGGGTGNVVDLADVAVNAPGTLVAGKNSGVTAAGTYVAPTPAATVTAPPQQFAVTNRTTGNITLQVPNPSGTVLNLTLLPGEATAFRQVTTSGYINAPSNKPLGQLDQRYVGALLDTAVAAGGTIVAGTRGVASAAGTYSAPAPAAAVGTPPQRFGFANRFNAVVNLQVPAIDGTVETLAVLPGSVVSFYQTSTQGYSGDSDFRRLDQLDGRYVPKSSPVSTTLGADVNCPVSVITDVMFITLGVGTWLVSTTMTMTAGGTASIDAIVAVGTATATFGGPTTTSYKAANANPVNIGIDTLVVVTAAGTIKAQIAAGSGSAATAKAAGMGPAALPGATGMTAVRVA